RPFLLVLAHGALLTSKLRSSRLHSLSYTLWIDPQPLLTEWLTRQLLSTLESQIQITHPAPVGMIRILMFLPSILCSRQEKDYELSHRSGSMVSTIEKGVLSLLFEGR